MKIRNEGLLWFLVCGVPALFLCFVGLAALLVRWDRLATWCERAVAELQGSTESRPTTLK